MEQNVPSSYNYFDRNLIEDKLELSVFKIVIDWPFHAIGFDLCYSYL